MRPGWAICATLSLSLASCTAPLVDEGVAKFQAGNAQATSLLQREAESVVSASRFRSMYSYFGAGGPKLVVAEDAARQFANYACMQSSKFEAMRATQATVTSLKLPDTTDRPATRKESDVELQLLASEQKAKKCIDETIAYLMLLPAQLPNVGLVPVSDKDIQAGGLSIAAVGALIGVAGTGVALLNSVWAGLKAEARAADIKAKVASAQVQRVVSQAFHDLSQEDTALKRFCESPLLTHQRICDGLRPNQTQASASEHFEIDESRTDPVCLRIDLVEGAPRPPNKYPIMNTATLLRKWFSVRISYNQFLDYKAAGSAFSRDSANWIAAMPGFEQRRKLTDTSIAEYLAIPPAADIVVEQRQAWADLTAVSCGKLKPEQLYTAMTAFVARMTAINDSYGKTSESVDKYTKASSPADGQ